MGASRLDARVAAWSAETDLDAAVADLLARDALELPPYPAVALRIARLVREGDYGLDALARLAASDQSLATDLLRAANSACYLRGAPVVSLAQAVQRVGAEELARLALASGLGSAAYARGPLAPLRRKAWHEALSAAVLCRELARARALSPDDAFSCGLLHDFGRVVAITAIERITAGARPARAMPARFWEAVVDRYHVVLGAALSARWGLPRLVADAIALHHAASADAAAEPALVEVVRAVDPIVGLLGERAHLGAGDAAGLAALSDADVEGLERGIAVLPGFVASFEREPPPAEDGLLARPAVPHVSPAERAVRVRAAGREYAVVGFAAHQLVVRGRAPLAEGVLLEVEALEPERVAFHARVLLCWAEREAFSAVLAPFALTGPALLHWQGLVAGGGAA